MKSLVVIDELLCGTVKEVDEESSTVVIGGTLYLDGETMDTELDVISRSAYLPRKGDVVLCEVIITRQGYQTNRFYYPGTRIEHLVIPSEEKEECMNVLRRYGASMYSEAGIRYAEKKAIEAGNDDDANYCNYLLTSAKRENLFFGNCIPRSSGEYFFISLPVNKNKVTTWYSISLSSDTTKKLFSTEKKSVTALVRCGEIKKVEKNGTVYLNARAFRVHV